MACACEPQARGLAVVAVDHVDRIVDDRRARFEDLFCAARLRGAPELEQQSFTSAHAALVGKCWMIDRADRCVAIIAQFSGCDQLFILRTSVDRLDCSGVGLELRSTEDPCADRPSTNGTLHKVPRSAPRSVMRASMSIGAE
jgi:hypothetical protein